MDSFTAINITKHALGNRRIEAVRMLRHETGLGLSEAYNYIELSDPLPPHVRPADVTEGECLFSNLYKAIMRDFVVAPSDRLAALMREAREILGQMERVLAEVMQNEQALIESQ